MLVNAIEFSNIWRSYNHKKFPNARFALITDLNILSEYVEDCDFPTLAISAICFIETYGKTLPNLTQYIRCLYNRFSLEDLSVRAASVSAIAGFAQVNEDTKNKVMGLLKKCLGDPDGEVRDRASFYLEMLRNYDKVKDIINYGNISGVRLTF